MFEAIGTQATIALIATIASVFVLTLLGTTISKFFRRCGADEALLRTGQGGNRVVLGGGVMVYPILHQLLRVSLRSVKLSVERSGKNALVTADKIKANVSTELYVKVEPIAEDVVAAARSFGERNLDDHTIAELIEGKLTDALRSVAANQTFMSLHGKRKEFAEHIQVALSEELKKNGLTLENVSITSLSMLSVSDLDPTDVFDAEGLRAITESVTTNREKTNQIQREKENLIHGQNVTAKMRQLELDQAARQAEADQDRNVREYAARQSSETARAVFTHEQAKETAAYEKQAMVEKARITQEQEIAVANAHKALAEREAQIATERAAAGAEIAKGREIRVAEIERQKVLEAAEIDRMKVIEASTIVKEQTIETARVEKLVAITRSEEQAARAGADKALALADEERAKQSIVTVEATARAERDKAISTLEAEARAEVERALAEGEAKKAAALAEARGQHARGEAMAMEAETTALANRKRAEAQAEADGDRIRAEVRALSAMKEAEAQKILAEAEGVRGLAQATARWKMVEAENHVSHELVMREIALEAIRTAPAAIRELMAPAQRISEIKILQTSGLFGGGGNGDAALGGITPILKTVMEAGAAYPLLKELMAFGGVSPASIMGDLKGLLGSGDSSAAAGATPLLPDDAPLVDLGSDALSLSAANSSTPDPKMSELIPVFDDDEPVTGPVPVAGAPHLPAGVASAS